MRTRTDSPRRGFTLIEVMIATTVLAMCMSVVVVSFTTVFDIKVAGERELDSMHHGEFMMELISEALRSAAFLGEATEKFGFRIEDNGDDRDEISWVTSSSAFIQPRSPLKHGLHRLLIRVADGDEGGLSVLAYPYLIDDSEESDWEAKDEDEWVVSRRVKEFNCRCYNFSDQDWDDEWENERSIPQWVEITLGVEVPVPGEEDETEIKRIVRVVEIPVGLFARNQSRIAAERAREAETENAEREAAISAQQGGGATAVPQPGARRPVGGTGIPFPQGGGGGIRSQFDPREVRR